MGALHPDMGEQESAGAAWLAGVTEDAVARLLAGLGHRLRALRPLARGGAVNRVLALRTDGPELVLRVSCAHRLFAGHKTRSEVEVMAHVRRHTRVPVPEVLAFSADAASSPWGASTS